MLDHLRQLAIFAKVVETGSFRAAAQILTLSPSVVSHHISKLEENLGVALLYRSTRKLSLTEDGARLLESVQAMVAAAETGLDCINAASPEPAGRLRVTAPAVLAHSGLIDDIVAFATAYPQVELDISFTDVRRDIIGEGIDLAIRMGWLEDSALMARKVTTVDRLLLTTPAYLEGQDLPETPRDLENWQFLHLSNVGRRFAFENESGERIDVKPNARVVVDDAIALYRLVRGGFGVGTIPGFLAADDLAAGKLVRLLPDWRPQPLGIYAVWPPNAPRDSLTARFVRYLGKGSTDRDASNHRSL